MCSEIQKEVTLGLSTLSLHPNALMSQDSNSKKPNSLHNKCIWSTFLAISRWKCVIEVPVGQWGTEPGVLLSQQCSNPSFGSDWGPLGVVLLLEAQVSFKWKDNDPMQTLRCWGFGSQEFLLVSEWLAPKTPWTFFLKSLGEKGLVAL